MSKLETNPVLLTEERALIIIRAIPKFLFLLLLLALGVGAGIWVLAQLIYP